MMADVMPHDDSPKPTKEMQDKIDRAGIKTTNAGANIASAESLIQRATSTLDEGKKLANQAKSDFMKSADPLGDEPHPPKDWDTVTTMLQRATSHLNALQESIEEAKDMAKQ